MGNFSSSALSSVHPVAVHADIISKQVSSPVTKPASSFFQFVRDAFKTLTLAYDDAVAAIAGSSVVISEIEECWYNELVADVNTLRGHCVARCAPTPRQVQVQEDEELASTSLFLGPSDSIVTTINGSLLAVYPSKTWKRSADDDDTSSLSTEETDDESKCGFSDSEAEDYFHDSESDDDEDDEEYHDHQDHCCVQRPEVEYYKDDDDTVTKADRLLRLASLGSSRELPPVYVDDYLCPCGECPAYHRIACDVRHIVTWRGAKEQNSIIRVLQAFSTYNEVIGYHPEMIEAAEECLQVWLGDEDRAFNSLVMLYDEVPQLCA